MKKILIVFTAIFLVNSWLWGQQSTTIESIRENPRHFNQEYVEFTGYIERYVPGTAATTSFYKIRGDYGQSIRVNTSSQRPTINARYRVSGTVISDQEMLLVIEERKTRLSEAPDVPPHQEITVTPSPGTTWNNLILIAIVVLALIVIVGALVLLFNRLAKPKALNWRVPDASLSDDSATPPVPLSKMSGSGFASQDMSQQYETVRVETSVPPTLKFIPGKLLITNGPDKGKTLILSGYPTPEGNVLTIGRDFRDWRDLPRLSGDRKYAHVRIKDDSRTLSRIQAEIIYRAGRVYLKNLSEVNPCKVNGTDVAVNESVELSTGAKITTGFIEFSYQAQV